MLYFLPPETWLYIFSFLDLPDLASLAQACPELLPLVEDPVLRRERLLVVAPSRVSHSLFGTSSTGLPLRSTLPELVHRGIIRGVGVERRWRDGLYFYTTLMVTQYENSMRLKWTHARNVLSHTLRARSSNPGARTAFYRSRVLPRDAASTTVSPPLVSAVRRLRWALKRDHLAHFVKDRSDMVKNGGLNKWLEGNGRAVMWRENERIRLALCPGIKGIVKFFEGLAL
ncbi:uncharacterized protein BXZ73DRAFT_89996 [Epithele typhae]|uniref:uncharacterized protein n=1 Tax=Epithele typhae TaxID=378194 RepID=UPI002007E366|nr:uncharacterized protein BXZ73DRAFT_89996 [Epithele typhae]KAH9932050.1 hypothetical protein BXZ73DRAFT_89996 [Epithele typhae]